MRRRGRYFVSSGSSSRSRLSPWVFWLVFFFLAALVPSRIAALTISEEELARLEAILTELQDTNAQLKLDLSASQSSLEKLRTSFDQYAKEAEDTAIGLMKEKQALERQRNGWRAATVVTGAGMVALVIALIIVK